MEFFMFLIVFLFANSVYAQSPAPKIESVQQQSERSVEIKWTTSPGDYQLTRYVVQLMENGEQSSIKEWPAQMKASDRVLTLFNFKNVLSTSYIDCRNKCINDAACTYSDRFYITKSNYNCILQYGIVLGNNSKVDNDSEHMSLREYEDKTVIENLPYNNIYKFRVKVYDFKSKQWSYFSEWSDEVDMKINLQLKVSRIQFDRIKIEWNQMNTFSQANYVISKYWLTVKRNNADYISQELADKNFFEKFLLSPNYDSEFYKSEQATAITEENCYLKCVQTYNCVLAVHFQNGPTMIYFNGSGTTTSITKNACFNKAKLNMYSATLSRVGTSSYSIKNIATNFEKGNLTVNNNYTVQLECLTPFGTKCSSNKIILNLTDLKPVVTITNNNEEIESELSWSMKEDIDVDKIKLFVANNPESPTFIPNYIDENIDYDGSIYKDPLIINLNGCYEQCFNHPSCVSILWYSNNSCILRNNKNKTNNCPSDAKCLAIFDNTNHIKIKNQLVNTKYCYKILVRVSNGFDGIPSDEVCVMFGFTVAISQIEEKKYLIEKNTLELLCNHTAINQSLAKVEWLKNGVNIDDSNLQYELLNNDRTIRFHNITRYIHDGDYSCKVTFKEKQDIESAPISVIVRSFPGKPEILNASVLDNSSSIKWYFDDDGGLKITKIIFQYCEIPDFNKELQEIIYETDLLDNEIILNKSLPIDYYIRVIIYNEIGPSEPSDAINITCAKDNCKHEINVATSRPLINDERTTNKTIVITVSSSISGLVIILLIGAVIVFKIRRQRKASTPQQQQLVDSENQYNNLDIRNPTDRNLTNAYDNKIVETPVVSSPKVTKSETSHYNQTSHYNRLFDKKAITNDDSNNLYNSATASDKPDIRDKLYQYWQDNIENIDEIMRLEYSQISNPADLPTIEALKKCNYKKSRFKQIYPFDFNRVKLSEIDGIEGSDFINASHIEPTDGHKKFIAAQAPTQSTLHDFYRMIYEYKIKVIIMLTEFETNSSKQCVMYLNHDGELTRDGFNLKTMESENRCAYIKRTLLFTNNMDPEFQQTVTHYQYVKWPDKSIPDETRSIVELIEYINKKHGQEDWPILIHCSAGVGRTGTYIVLDTVLEMFEKQKEIDLVNFINTLRGQRVYLVQTWDQYKFIYQTILETYVFGNTKLTRENYLTRFNKLKAKLPNKETELQIEFKKLTFLRDKIRHFSFYNECPNRFASDKFKPYDEALLMLDKLAANDSSSRLIDAVFLVNSHVPLEFMIASNPIEIHQFPRLVLKMQPTIIVSLSMFMQIPELDTTQTIEEGFNVTKNSQYNQDEFSMHGLNIQKLPPNELSMQTIYLDHSNNWNEENLPKDKALFVKFINCVLGLADIQREAIKIDPLVLVYSSDAGDRSAMFVAATVLIHTIKNYEFFDAFQTVYWLRKYRENMISEFDNYKCLYELACAYFEEMKNLRETE